MDFVMIKTILENVNGMVEIVVEPMWKENTVQIVIVWIQNFHVESNEKIE